MRKALTIIFTSLAIASIGQQKQSITHRGIDDNGKTLKLSLVVKNDSTSISFDREYNVVGLSKEQKDELIKRVEDSLKIKLPQSQVTKRETTTKQLVADAVMDYIDAFYFGDTTKLFRSISPTVVKYGYSRKKDSTTYIGMPMSFQQMTDYVLGVKAKPDLKAATRFKKVEVFDYEDQTASAKCTAWWGIDYLLLAKINGKWMITNVLWQSTPIKQ